MPHHFDAERRALRRYRGAQDESDGVVFENLLLAAREPRVRISFGEGGGEGRVHWPGRNAGENTMGIEADGTIKGCPSLPTVGYAGGTVRALTLEKIWRDTPDSTST